MRVCIQAVISQARATRAHQIWFCAKACRGRLVRPVCLAARMRSSALARRRCRSSSAASWPRRVLVANAVTRIPSGSVRRGNPTELAAARHLERGARLACEAADLDRSRCAAAYGANREWVLT